MRRSGYSSVEWTPQEIFVIAQFFNFYYTILVCFTKSYNGNFLSFFIKWRKWILTLFRIRFEKDFQGNIICYTLLNMGGKFNFVNRKLNEKFLFQQLFIIGNS